MLEEQKVYLWIIVNKFLSMSRTRYYRATCTNYRVDSLDVLKKKTTDPDPRNEPNICSGGLHRMICLQIYRKPRISVLYLSWSCSAFGKRGKKTQCRLNKKVLDRFNFRNKLPTFFILESF